MTAYSARPVFGVRALFLAAVTFPVSCGGAFAQSAAGSALTVSDDDIVITARKSNERLQDTPISVNALSAKQLQERGAVDVKDILRSVPGFSFSNVERGLGNYSIRGVSTVAASPTVGIYLDDISLVTIATLFSGAFDPVFFDMERVEVLKGPQGTLYGGSSMGGAIKYVSAKPNLGEWGGSAAIGLAATAHGSASYNGEAVINLPIVADTLAIRTGGFYRHDGGYIDNVAGLEIQNSNRSSEPSPDYVPQTLNSLSTRDRNNQNSGETLAGRLSLLWEPDSTWSILPALFYQDYKLRNPSQFFTNLPSLTSTYRLAQPTHDRAGIYSLAVDKDVGFAKVTSLTAYFDRRLNFTRDYSFFIGGLVPPAFSLTSNNVSISRTKTFSEELRIGSNGGPAAPLQWVAGLFYSDQDDTLDQIVTTPGAIPILGSETGYEGVTRTRMKQYAAFGEASYEVADGLSVMAGVRLFQVKQSLDLVADGPFNGGLTIITDRRSNEKGVNPKIGASYKAAPNNMVFVSAAKGFRPGGPNRSQISPLLCAVDLERLGLSAAPVAYESDDLWSYEIGTKNQFADGSVTLNGALFYTDWKNIQQQVNLTNCGFQFTGNAGSAHVKGAEAETRIQLGSALSFGGTVTYTDAKIVEAAAGAAAQDGQEVQAVPKWMASANLSYTIPIGGEWQAELRAEYQYQSRARQQFENVQAVSFVDGILGVVPNLNEFREGYQVVNTSAAFNHGSMQVRLYVNNVFDVSPWIDTNLGFGSDRSTTIRPRTVGIDVRQKF